MITSMLGESDQVIHLKVILVDSGREFFVSVVYAANEEVFVVRYGIICVLLVEVLRIVLG